MSELPKGWASATLADLGVWKGGGTPSKAHAEYWGGGIPWVSPKDMKSATIRTTVDTISAEAIQNSSTSLIKAGSVLIVTRSGILARTLPVAVNALDVTVNQDMRALTPHPWILPEFVRYFLQGSERAILQGCVKDGTTVHSVELSSLMAWSLPIPPLPEQHRIVAKIEELFSELDASEESLTRARAQLGLYRQSLLKAAFQGTLTADWRAANPDKLETPEALLARIQKEREGWYREEQEQWELRCSEWSATGRIGPRPARPDPYTQANPIAETELDTFPKLPSGWHYVRLNEVACIGSGVSVSKGRQLEDPVEVAYLRVANVQRGHLDLSVLKSMPVERSQVPSLALRPFDILFNEGGDRDKLGRGWIWEGAVAPCITQNHVFRGTLYHASAAAAKLVSYWGNSHGQDYFEKGGKQTTNLASINKTVLKALPVPVMSPEETRVLIDRLEAAMTDIAAAETEVATALAKITALRQSILKKAFAGELVPQDPDDEPAADLLARIRAEALATGPKRKKNTVTKRTEKA